MSGIITLACPTCSAMLQIPSSTRTLTCAYCGNRHLIHREDGNIHIEALIRNMSEMRLEIDKAAAELAIPRIKSEIVELQIEIEAIEQTDLVEWVGTSAAAQGGSAILIVDIIVFLIGLLIASPIMMASTVLLFFVIIKLITKSSNQVAQAARAKRAAALAPLSEMLSTKKRVLARHQQIINT